MVFQQNKKASLAHRVMTHVEKERVHTRAQPSPKQAYRKTTSFSFFFFLINYQCKTTSFCTAISGKKTLNQRVAHSPHRRPQTPTGLPTLLIYPVVLDFLSPQHDDVVDYISTQIDLPLSRRGDVDYISTFLPMRRRRLRSSRFSRLHFRRIAATNTIIQGILFDLII